MSVERVEADCATEHTADDWVRAVRRSIRVMREHLGDDYSLRELARSAWLSPFHFHRVFLKVTDSTPARFLAAWRMAEAKRMLATSRVSVTEICMRIGYSSLGTFTSQFTRAVGVPPGRFRRLVAAYGDRPCNDVLRAIRPAQPVDPALTVPVTGGPPGALAVVGLFRSGIPQERPVECAIVAVPGSARFSVAPPDARPLAVVFDDSVTVAEAVADAELDRCWVAAGPDLRLRPRRPTDPPVVLALPLLLVTEQSVVPAA
ncbi:helix-turn-helix domain-containing protein [Symbioplanes lichenis]|uniref:helix-turn-helix domain-containing protein n=1 Tax=Symbioplanes lichenis TaxID=1629072 RepID=UPI00273982D0|nr:AraC family transcriptional regulator [Actinoplanes lichenis]